MLDPQRYILLGKRKSDGAEVYRDTHYWVRQGNPKYPTPHQSQRETNRRLRQMNKPDGEGG